MTVPLAGVRVIDTTDGRGSACTRFLADLGADVVMVEPVGGSLARRDAALFALRAANKRSIEIDLATAAGVEQLHALLQTADIWVDGHPPGQLERLGLAPDDVHTRHPHAVIATITDFGSFGPYSGWTATDEVLFALAGQLSRSGVPGRPPFPIPGRLAEETSEVQAAWAILVAYWNRLESGHGDVLDISRHEATAQVFDPPFGSIGSAAAQRGQGAPSGREPAVMYPIFECADGHVRILLLAPRQWHGMRAWLGEPEQFSDRRYDNARARFEAAGQLYPLIAELCHHRAMADLVAEGQRRGVPIAPVLSPAQALAAEHFRARRTFTEVSIGDRVAVLPAGYVFVDGERAGIRTPAPAPGSDSASFSWRDDPIECSDSPTEAGGSPLRGLRVLDLGVIVMGGEAGRLLADQGADVIKVENRRFPDGARMAGMTSYFAAGQRNKRSLGVDLRHPAGVALFERLVVAADVLLSNFKPGTLESLGIAPARLRELNPALILVTCSAMGEFGPWKDWMGYGPIVRSVTGLTAMWCDPGVENGFGDTTTIFPDHFAARIVDCAVLAAMIRRRRDGRGAHIECSQAEVIITSLGSVYAREASRGSSPGELHDAVWGVYPCDGDDEWCVITTRGIDDWERLVEVLDVDELRDVAFARPEARAMARDEINALVAAWTSRRAASDVAAQLQSVGVPAARMQHVRDLPRDPHLLARQFFRTMTQPGVEGEVLMERGLAVARHLTDRSDRPAPFYGQHTREVCCEVLGLDDAAVDALVHEAALDELSERDATILHAAPAATVVFPNPDAPV